MSTAIEWSLGLPCPDQRDAIVASVVDGAHAPSDSAIAEHLRHCATCRAFRDSLRTQRMLVRKLAEEQQEELKKRERQRKLKSEMTEWVDQELRMRGERELARSLWRCGTAVLRLDPGAARHLFTESAAGRIDEASIEGLLTDASSSLEATNFETRTSSSAIARVRTRFARILELFSHLVSPSLADRKETIRLIADLAESLSDSIRGPIQTMRAYVEWYHGSESLVAGLFHQALLASSDSVQRAHAIANVALWNSSQGWLDAAIELGREAASSCDRFATPRVNLAVWSTIAGDRRSADRYFAEAAAIVGPVLFRRHWPWALVYGWLKSSLLLTNAPPREQARAVDSMWIAYHRWIGLPSSNQEKPVTLRSESSP